MFKPPFLITNPTNIRYLTGFVGAVPGERESYVLFTKDAIYLFTNGLYKEEAVKLTNPTNPTNNPIKLPIQFVEISRENPLSKELAKLLKELKITKLEFEEGDLTVAEHGRLRKELRGVMLVPTQNRVEEIRMIKRDDEIAFIKQAATLTDQCFTFIIPLLKPGVSEADIAWEIETFFRKHGATSAFSPIVAFGAHTSQPHYNPTPMLPLDSARGEQSTVLQKHDVALFDFGARVSGYCSDMTRMVFMGKPKDEWKEAYETVLTAQQKALDKLSHISIYEKNGSVSGAELDRLAKDSIRSAGYPPYPHSLGHGVGLDIHEAPRLTVKKDQEIKPGMVVTAEPGIYIEGQFGIRIEDLVLITANGIEIFSNSPKEIQVL